MQKQIVMGECEVSTGCSMREYEQQTIEEVVASAKHGNDEAMEYVLAKYKGLVRGLSRTLFLLDGDEDDLIQESSISRVSSSKPASSTKARNRSACPTSI